MKKVRVVNQFYGDVNERMKYPNDEYVTTNDHATALENKGLVEILGDTTEDASELEQGKDMTHKTAKTAAKRQTKEEKTETEDKAE